MNNIPCCFDYTATLDNLFKNICSKDRLQTKLQANRNENIDRRIFPEKELEIPM